MTGMYAVVHAACGHPTAVLPERAAADCVRQALAGAGQYRWRVRLVPAADVEAVLAPLRASGSVGERSCPVCLEDAAGAAAVLGGGR